jgi:hypothetical protein
MKRHLLMKLLAVVLPCVAAGTMLYVTRAQADVPTLPSKAAHEVLVPLNGQQVPVSVYAAGDILAVWPIPVFTADPKTGFVAVELEPPLKPGEPAKVNLGLVMNPAPVLKAARAAITTREGKTVPEFTSVLLRGLTIEQRAGKQTPVFEKFIQPGESSGSGQYTLTAWMPEAEAKVFVEELRAGKRHVEFRVTATLYAKRTSGEIDITAKVVKITETKAYTKLDGTGGDAKIGAKGNLIVQAPAAVTRSQQQELVAKVTEEIVLKLEIAGNPKTKELVSGLVTKWMEEQAFGPERQIDITVAELQKLNPYGFAPADLKPDVVEKFIADVQAFLSDENKGVTSFAAGGSGWGIKADASYSKDEFRKTLTDNGWKLEQEGKKFIPKSIAVRDVNRQNIHAHTGFRASSTESEYSVVNFDQQVTTRARIAMDMNPAELNRLAVLEEVVKAQGGQLTELSAKKVFASVAIGETHFKGDGKTYKPLKNGELDLNTTKEGRYLVMFEGCGIGFADRGHPTLSLQLTNNAEILASGHMRGYHPDPREVLYYNGTLTWVGVLPPGKHKFAIKAMANTDGNVSINVNMNNINKVHGSPHLERTAKLIVIQLD